MDGLRDRTRRLVEDRLAKMVEDWLAKMVEDQLAKKLLGVVFVEWKSYILCLVAQLWCIRQAHKNRRLKYRLHAFTIFYSSLGLPAGGLPAGGLPADGLLALDGLWQLGERSETRTLVGST